VNENSVVILDSNFKIIRDDGPLIDDTKRKLQQTGWYGFEDIRICEVQHDRFIFMCTLYDHEGGMISQMARCLAVYDGKVWQVKLVQPLKRFGGDKCKEKNWLLFNDIHKDASKVDERIMIYHWFPKFTLLRLPADGSAYSVYQQTDMKMGSLHEGSVAPIWVPAYECWIALVHVSWPSDPAKFYHRVIVLRKNFEICHYSAYFYFQKPQIEYCCGMCLSHDQKSIVFGYGVGDSSSYITSVPLETFMNKVVFMSD
jgi:hypothetical protein